MKRQLLLPVILCLSFLMGRLTHTHSQTITSIVVNPAVPLECTNTSVTIGGTLPCANATINGTSHNIIGNTITIFVDVFQPMICLPAILPLNLTEPLGMVPAGSYSIQVQYVVNGQVVTSSNSATTIGVCCTVNSNFLSSMGPFCVGDSVDLMAIDTTLAGYDWQIDGTSFDSSMQSSYVFTTAGTFTISLVGDDGSCTTMTDQSMTVSGPSVTIGQVNPEGCPGSMDGSIDLQLSGGTPPYTFNWSSGDSTEDISQLMAGLYVVTVGDNSNCSTTDSITVPGGIDVVAALSSATPPVLCLGDSAVLLAGGLGATHFNWLINGIPFPQQAQLSYIFPDTGSYEIMLIASNVSCSDSASTHFYVSAPIISNPVIEDETCTNSLDGSINLTVSAGFPAYSFLWSSGDTTQNISQAAGGEYVLSITDSMGCVTVDSFTIGTSLGVTADFMASTDPSICPAQTVQFTNTSQLANTFDWLRDGISFAQSQNASFTFPDSGIVEISLIAIEGICRDTSSMEFFINASPNILAHISGESCPESRDGAIDLSLTGGSGPFHFLWSTSDTTEDINGLSPGLFDVAIEDTATCIVRDTFEIETLGGAQAAFTAYPVAQGMQFLDQSDSLVVSWHWDFGTGGDTSTLQHPIFDYSVSGEYIVCLSTEDLYGCMDMVCDTIGFVLGISQEAFLPLQLFPNPAEKEVILDVREIIGQSAEISLFDVTGKRIFTRRQQIEGMYRMDLSGISPGIYQIHLRTEAQRFSGKLLKQ
ncbi:MAG: T9SS type A sorting domain-containing protein [Bacteroidota bacterium]